MTSTLQRIKVIAGILLLIVGAVGTLLPVIPGVPIMLAGLALMGADHPIVRHLKERLQRLRERRKSPVAE